MKQKRSIRLLALLAAITGLMTGCVGPAASTQPGVSDTVPVTDTLNVYCFQAGKADAFLFWNASGAILLDTGESGFGKVILAKLEELGITRLDCLILTHFDKDHVGGAKKLLESIPVGTVYQSNYPKTGADAYEKYLAALENLSVAPITVREELTVFLGDAVFTLSPPAREVYEQTPSNNSSLILTVTHGANRLLFLGDAEDARLSEFLSADPGTFAFVKLPHHGQWQSSLQTLLQKTAPQYALITSSDEKPEDTDTMELLARTGTETFLTRTAPVTIRSDGAMLSIAYSQ